MIQRLAVFSDSHGDTASLLRAAEIQREYCQMMVFCGDGLRDWEVLTGLYPQMETAAVAGNCDFASLLPPLRLVEFAGCRVLILHGHTHHVKSGLDPLRPPPGNIRPSWCSSATPTSPCGCMRTGSGT